VTLHVEGLEERLALSNVPPPWTDVNIGAPAAQGSATYSQATNSFAITAAGAGTAGTSDQFHFDYQPLTGDGVIKAQLAPPGPAGTQAQAGLMIRDGLGANATFVELAATSGGSASFEQRDGAGAPATSTAAGTTQPWMELVRDGNTLSAYFSPTGADGSWTLAGTTGLVMSSTVEVGMAVASGDSAVPATATFQNAGVTQTVPLGGNAGFRNAFVDLTNDVGQINTPSWGPGPAPDANGNPG
jgi:hypothetical protein